MRKRNLFKSIPKSPPKASCDDRLKLLSMELALAGGQVLKDHFDFTPEQVDLWMKLMAGQAKVNRVRYAAELAKKSIDEAVKDGKPANNNN